MMLTLMVIYCCALEINGLIRFSEIPDLNKQKNALGNQCGLLSPQQGGNVTADLPVRWTLSGARRKG